jgi:hypothetical protein
MHGMLLQDVSAGALLPPGKATHMLRQPWLLLLLRWFAAACWHAARKGSNTARCMTDSTSPPACKAQQVICAPRRHPDATAGM